MSVIPAAPPTPAKRPPHRPSYEPTNEARKMVRLMVAGGILQERIAGALGISRPTLAKHFRAEIDSGKTEIHTLSVGTVIATMREGGKDALTTYNRGGKNDAAAVRSNLSGAS
jgi:DNA invertase Pin-like site-specific DNA recombinase